MTSALALALCLASPLPALSPKEVPAETPVHLGVTLRQTHLAELEALRRGQQDPSSPLYHHWLGPEEFGARFGQPKATYGHVADWLGSTGMTVKLAPNRTFLEATGTAAEVEKLLSIRLRQVEGKPPSVHAPDRRPTFPAEIAPLVVHVAGLDTRVHLRRRINEQAGAPPALGPQDLRRFYGVQPLLDRGYVGQGQALVVLSTAEAPGNGPNPVDIQYFLSNVSDARAAFVQRVLPNPQNDVDMQQGGGVEFELDVEMQSVASPGAESITLEVSPASEVFTTGAQDIANNLPGATAVSVSLGTCEPAEQQMAAQGMDEAAALREAVVQGVTEGQTWSAASGDSGADDCQDGQTVAVDFPSSIPEVVAAGGSEIPNPAWDQNSALPAWQPEVVWNDGQQGGAGGGGQSILYPPPAYQEGFGLTGRSVPDIALIAGLPGVATDSTLPGQLFPVEGTSVASPLSAGIFGVIASRVGCRLGDVHAVLYALGHAQADGGTVVFHDITKGNVSYDGVTGPSAGPGFDSASGWGSLNVEAIADAWPSCSPPLLDGGSADAGLDGGAADGGNAYDAGTTTDGGVLPGVPYSQCGFIACDGGTLCTTLPEGPSACTVACNPADAGSCASGTICPNDALFDVDGGGACVPGCLTNADCASQPGTVCSGCEAVCVPGGNASAKIGDACQTSTDCPSGSYCLNQHGFSNGGYCTEACYPNVPASDPCACPGTSICLQSFAGDFCVATCADPGKACAQRPGYLCQIQDVGGGACLPACGILNFNGQTFDTCQVLGSSQPCDVDSGYCGGPAKDAGIDAGPTVPDGGTIDAGHAVGGDAGSGTPHKAKGCGCSPDENSPAAALWLLAIAAAAMLRRRPT